MPSANAGNKHRNRDLVQRQRANTTNSNGDKILQRKQPREREKKQQQQKGGRGGRRYAALRVNNEIRRYIKICK